MTRRNLSINIISLFIVTLFLGAGCEKQETLQLSSSSTLAEEKAAIESDSTVDLWFEQMQRLPKSPNGINYIFERLTTEDGLSQNNIHTIFQDSYGYLWIGTSDGLNRFDGYRFEVFSHNPVDESTISGNNIWTILEDASRNLWVGTDDGLNLYNRQSGKFTCFANDPDDPHSLSNNKVRSIIEDSEGDLWIGTWGGGLNRYDRQLDIFERYMFDIEKPGSLSDNFVKTIYEDSKGLIWIATSNGLNRFDPRTGRFIIFQRSAGSPNDIAEYELEMLFEGDSSYFWSGKPSPLDVDIQEMDPGLLSSNQIQTIIEGENRRLWIGTAGGLDCLNITTGRFDHYSYDADNPDSLSSDMVLSLFIDQNGSLWIGTSSGLNQFNEDSETFTRYSYNPDNPTNSHFLGNQIVNDIFQDISGSYWLGTSGGLNRFDQATSMFVHNYHDSDKAATLGGNMVWSFEEDSDIGFWIGTSVGLDRYDTRKGTFTPYGFQTSDGQSLEAIQVYSIFKDSSGLVWAGTSGGLFQYDPASRQFILYQPVADGSEENFLNLDETTILDIVEKPVGVLWLGTYGDGLINLNLNTGLIKSYVFDQDDPQSLSSNIVSVLLVDHDGCLFAGTRGGGFNQYLQGQDAFLRYVSDPNDPASLSENNITDMFESSSREIWIATMSGLNHFDRQNNDFDVLLASDGLASDVVYGILEDGQGYFWASTNNGITRFNHDGTNFRTFTYQYGLQANEFNQGAAFASIDSLLFFGGVNGFTVFDTAYLVENSYQAPVRVTDLFQSGEKIELPGLAGMNTQIDLEWPKNYFEFNASVLNFIQREENRVQYKLNPQDDEWHSLEPYQTASYENLPGGQYELWLRGANNDGLWSEAEQILVINVKPPFWETRLFRFGGALFALAVILIAVQMRIMSIRKYSRVLESEVEERTEDIEKRRKVAEGLREILFRINSDQAIEDSLDFVVCQTNRLMRTRVALIFNIGDGKEPEIVAYANAPDFKLEGLMDPESLNQELENWAKNVLSSKKVFRMDFGRKMEKYLAEKQIYFRIAPIYSMKKALGALAVLEDDEVVIDDEDLDLLRSLADQAGLAMENANLRSNAEEIAVVAERNRIARDLHDAITQTLFSANLIAESLPKIMKKDINEGAKNLQELQKLNKSALSEMRTLLLELRPKVIPDIKLADLLEQMADAVKGRVGLIVELNIRESVRLPDNIHMQIYRIAQESVANIIKHAKAGQMRVRFNSKRYKRNGRYYLKAEMTIEDDGVGFDPQAVAGVHFGVRDMFERAESIGAVLKIISNPESGTSLKFEWKGKDLEQDEGC